MCMMVVAAASCHSDYEDYTTAGEIGLTLPVNGEVEVIQYSLEMMNLNSRDVITAAGKTQSVIAVSDMLRGAYSINIEGVVRYRDVSDKVITQQFRAQSEFVPMVENHNIVELEMILMGR